jgi:hypothetical protein
VKLLLDVCQCGPLSQSKRCGHERVALFSPFRLGDDVGLVGVIMPNVVGWLGVELPHKGEALVCTWHGMVATQHAVTGYGVICAHPVDRKNC